MEKEIDFNGYKLLINSNGIIKKLVKDNWITIKGCDDGKGYLQIRLDKKYRIHRIIGYAFLDLDINDRNQYIDHINGIRNDNSIENLRIVSKQQNDWNKHKENKIRKINNRYYPRIMVNRKEISLGGFDTEEEARIAFNNAKNIYHPMD